MASALRDQLRRALRQVEHLDEGEGVFRADEVAFFVDGRLVVEFAGSNSVGIRLTKALIRERQAALKADGRAEPIKSGSDWIEVAFRSAADLPWVVELATAAVPAYLPTGRTPKPAPTGNELARLRRFH